jgi:RNA polymerase sigma-70 factor, ECF subfamily
VVLPPESDESSTGEPEQSLAFVEVNLVERAQAGDAEAFAKLYDLNVARVYRYVYYHLGNQADAEDVTQQTFLQAWRSVRTYKPGPSPLIAWLLTIAHNTAVSLRRRTKDETRFEVEPAATHRWSDPEAQALSRYDRLAVRRAILQLRPDQQQVILLRFLEQLDYEQIAAALGKREGNIRVIQHRALIELRRLLAGEVAER